VSRRRWEQDSRIHIQEVPGRLEVLVVDGDHDAPLDLLRAERVVQLQRDARACDQAGKPASTGLRRRSSHHS